MVSRFLSRKRRLLVVSVALLGAFFVTIGFSGNMSLQMDESEVEDHFSSRGQQAPVFYEHKDSAGVLFLARSGSGPSVVFVHGSPGSWDNFAHMLSDTSLNSRFTLAAVDRPGFGNTMPKGPEPSLEVQAERIQAAVGAAGIPLPAIWVGHSLGGPVVARLAADYPEAVSGLLLVAPSMDPELEKRRWYNWLGKFPLIKWGLPREWRNSNEEIFPLKAELEELKPLLGNVRVPTIVIQGDRDKLVPPENADYVKREMPEGVVELRILKGVNHFIPWSNPDDTKRAIVDLSELAERP